MSILSSKDTYIKTFFTGIIMGACDIVPGVSGGTIAFISGIYERLLGSLRACIDSITFSYLTKGQIMAARRHVDGTFLLTLFAGVGVSIFSLAAVLDQALSSSPHLVWGFFFGLVVGSILLLLREQIDTSWKSFVYLVLGVAVAIIIVQLSPTQVMPTWRMIILSAMIAICAMILPGISGSFLLLIMGMYAHLIGAIQSRDIIFLGLFVFGAAVGLMLFSHVLSFLLKKYHTSMMMILIGFMLGALPKLWPRQNSAETIIDRHGQEVTVDTQLVLPTAYEGKSQVFLVFLLGLLGLCSSWGIVLLSRSNKQSTSSR